MYPARYGESTAWSLASRCVAISVVLFRRVQRIQKRPKRAAAVAHPLLLFAARLAKRAAQLAREEQRIVAKSVRSERCLENATIHGPATRQRFRGVDIRGNTHVVGTPVSDTMQTLEQQPIVLFVER